jgi:hypothetical protein
MIWGEYDLEILGSRWGYLQLTTVVEDSPRGGFQLRCRLRARWSLQAKIVFWSLCGFELLVLGVMSRGKPWAWLALLTLPVLAGVLHRELRNMQSVLVVFLDKLAKDWNLAKLQAPAEDTPPEAAAGASRTITPSRAATGPYAEFSGPAESQTSEGAFGLEARREKADSL